MKKSLLLTTLICTMFLTSCFNKSKEVDIYFIGSVQGYFENFSNLKTFLATNKHKDSLVLSSGNYFSKTPEGIYSRGENIFKLLSLVGTDVVGLNSEDLEFGWKNLKNNINKKTVSIVSSNVSNGLLKKYYIKEINGARFGVLSVISNQKLENFEPTKLEGLKIKQDVLEIKDLTQKLKKQVDVFVLLTDQQLLSKHFLNEDLGVDIILTNTDDKYDKKQDDFYQENGMFVASCQNKLEDLCKLKVKLKKNKKIRKIYFEKHSLTTLEKDENIENIVSNIYKNINKKINKKIAKNEQEIAHNINAPSPMANKVAQCLSRVYRRGVIINSEIIKQGLAVGEVSQRNVYEIMPKEHHTILLDIKGYQLKKAISQTFQTNPTPWLGLGGLEIVYTENKKGELKLLNISRNGNNILDWQTYRLAISDDILRGSLAHDEFLDMVELKKTYKPINELLTWCFRTERKVKQPKNGYTQIDKKN
ncbi:MAG: hypothetical protein HOG70_01560 [Elusimicrobiaceae bacterium]|nr:hypothetical protein [Elusimicrobiaceae bacterium]